jgi:hypothetical protein
MLNRTVLKYGARFGGLLLGNSVPVLAVLLRAKFDVFRDESG